MADNFGTVHDYGRRLWTAVLGAERWPTLAGKPLGITHRQPAGAVGAGPDPGRVGIGQRSGTTSGPAGGRSDALRVRVGKHVRKRPETAPETRPAFRWYTCTGYSGNALKTRSMGIYGDRRFWA